MGWHKDKSAARQRLLRELAQFAHLKKIRITVIFDGAPEINIADGSSFRGVKVFYAREGSDADARIVEFVEREKNRPALKVVTSDLQLSSRVRACSVSVVKSGQFRNLMAAAMMEEQEPEAKVAEGEMSEWMRYFGVDETDDE